MRVDFNPDVFQNAEDLTDILLLLRSFIEGPHDWVADATTLAAAELYLREHAPRLAEIYLDLARKGTVAATWIAATGSSSVVKIAAAALADYASDLSRPALIIVEDRDSDASFIRVISKVFGAEKVSAAINNSWLEFEHGGGSGIERVAQGKARLYRRCIRVAVLMDSDRMMPGEPTQAYEKAARLAANGIAVHVLERREAENYVPYRVLAMAGKAADSARKLTLLKSLTPDQRGFFDMKHGFGSPDRSPKIPRAQTGLYRSLQMSDKLSLRGGFGEDLLRRMEDVCSSLVEQDFTMLGAGVETELRNLLATLASVI